MKINKKSKGYILTEVLIGSILQAVFIVSLAASVYWLTMFSVRTHYLLLAREKGQRIVAHIDSRIKNCGYGLWACQIPHDVRLDSISYNGNLGEALSYDHQKNDNSLFSSSKQVVRIYKNTDRETPVKFEQNEEIQYGVGFSILYADPTGYILSADNEKELSNEVTTAEFRRVSQRNKKIFPESTDGKILHSWGVIPSVGLPFRLTFDRTDEAHITLNKYLNNVSVTLSTAIEILPLREEYFYISGDDFSYKNMDVEGKEEYTFSGYGWGKNNPYVDGVLRIFCEWNKNTQILNLYILTSGGTKPVGMEAQEKPNNWSKYDKREFRHPNNNFDDLYESTFKDHIFYVTRASWKLHNIP